MKITTKKVILFVYTVKSKTILSYSTSKIDDGWIRCSACLSWAHEACAGCKEENDDFVCELCIELLNLDHLLYNVISRHQEFNKYFCTYK